MPVYPVYPVMHTFQLYNDVPAIECGDASLMSEEYDDRWRFLDPTLWSHQSIQGPDAVSTAHLMSLKRHLSDLTNSANGHGNLSPTTMLGHEFSHLGFQAPFLSDSQGFHGLRCMSPNGHVAGSFSSTTSASSECASSPDAARYSAKLFYAPYDSQELSSSPIYNEGATFGNWAPQKLYQQSLMHSASSYDNRAACNLKDLQYTADLDVDVDEDALEENDCIRVEVHGPEELALSLGTQSFRDEALGQSIRDDASSFRDDEEDVYQQSDADSEYIPELPERGSSNPVKSPGRKTPKMRRLINNTVLGEPKVTKSTPRKSSSTRGPSGRPAKSAANTQKRVFTCTFSRYGCEATFGSKNEWKRHVGSQHLQLGFYRCDTGFCNADGHSSTTTKSPSSTTKTYNDFNRKDLFTQHHRRMHTPWSSASKEPSAKVKQDFENSLEDVRQRCWHEKRTPPQRSTCGFCRRVFEGSSGWDERMEHVGKHFEGKHNGVVDVENSQEEEDEDLRDWAVREGIVKDYGTRGFWLVGMEPVDITSHAAVNVGGGGGGGGGRNTRRRVRARSEVTDEEDVDAEGENE